MADQNTIELRYVQNSPTLQRFHASRKRYRLIEGPVGCLAGESRIWTEDGLERIDVLHQRGRPFRVWSRRLDGSVGLELATAPFIKGRERLCRIDLDGGGFFRGADAHLVQLFDGSWKKIGDMSSGERLMGRLPFHYVKYVRHGWRRETYYDLTVEATGNYIGEWGIIHHNSGKTVACCWEIFHAMHRMVPCRDGVRRSRWAFIRDTAANLKDTTMETWLRCFPEKNKQRPHGITEVYWSDPPSMRVRMPCAWDGGKTMVEADIFCRHQQQEADAENLKSLDLTGYFVNEANKIPERNISMLNSRIKRFPSADDLILGPNGERLTPRFFGVLDSNMPDDQSWIYRIAEVKKPRLWEVFRQPPAMFREKNAKGEIIYVPNRGQKIAMGIPPADNIEHLNGGWNYYIEQVPPHSANPHDWVKVYICAEYGTLSNGRVVYPDYNDAVHYKDIAVKFDPSRTLFLGFDWGLTPSVLFAQMTESGQIQIIDEIDGTLPGAPGIEQAWLTRIKPKLVNEYNWGRGTQIFAIGDPAGRGRDQVSANTPIKYLADQGLTVVPCATNAQGERMGAVDHFLHRMAGGGQPALLVTRKAQKLRGGLSQWYYFEKKENCRDDVYAGTPKDNSYTHLQDCLQYLCHALKHPDRYGVKWLNGSASFLAGGGVGEASQLACDMGGLV